MCIGRNGKTDHGYMALGNRLRGSTAEVMAGQTYSEYALSGGSRSTKDFKKEQAKLAEANKGQAVSVTESNAPEADAAASAQTNTVRRRRTGANAFGTAQDATILNATNTAAAAPQGMLLGG